MRAEIKRGFTLIELIVSISIAVILFAVIVSGFSGQRELTSLNLAIDDCLSYLTKARARTLSSENSAHYGVHFETTKFVLFAGDTYNAGDPDNVVRNLSSDVEMSNTDLTGGAVDVVFKRLTGETDVSGTITFRLTSDPTITRILWVEYTGLAFLQ